MTSRPRKQRRRGPLIIWKGPGGCRMGNMLNMIFDVDGTSKMIYTTKQQRFWLKAILLPCFFSGQKTCRTTSSLWCFALEALRRVRAVSLVQLHAPPSWSPSVRGKTACDVVFSSMWNFPLWSFFFLLSYRTSLVRPYRHQTIESNWHQVTQFTSAI